MAEVIKFVSRNRTKGELAEKNIKAENIEYDCALPQYWVNKVQSGFTQETLEKWGSLTSHFVYVYDNSEDNRSEYIMPLTKTGCKILGLLALSIV